MGTEAKKVLIVDDDNEIREIISQILREEGYEVACACNGSEALALLRGSLKPNLILLDLMMPVMDGFQFRIEQESNAEWAAIPVVILTAAGHVDEKADSLHAAGYLKKPLSVENLLDTVERV